MCNLKEVYGASYAGTLDMKAMSNSVQSLDNELVKIGN
jgi:hypothetical protein